MRQFALSLLGLAALSASALSQSTPLTAELMWNGYNRPVQILPAPGDPTRLFVVEQNQADIHVIHNGVQIATPFLDLSGLVTTGGNEQGLLGMAFHPDYNSNGLFYVNYTATGGGATRVVRYQRNAGNPNLADPGSAQTVIQISQPQSNHNGGGLVFGPDGYLWIATGDGGNFNDTGSGHAAGGNAQSGTSLLGKMLRIDINGDDFPGNANLNYAIPPTNPHIGNGAILDEIIHLGLRNPWRYSFDRETGDLIIGDVGQNAREEIDFLDSADVLASTAVNWGWRCTEGLACTGLSGCTCGDPNLTLSTINYFHSVGRSVTGGYVYRGDAIPDLDGDYLYADYQFSKVFRARFDPVTSVEITGQIDPPGTLAINGPASFGEDQDGELYICDLSNGEIFKIVPDGPFLGLGSAYAGTNGDPTLFGTGGVGPGEAGSLHLRDGPPSALTLALGSLSATPASFFGGTLIPTVPATLQLFFFTNASGEIDLPWADLGTNPPGLEIYIQFAFDDPGAQFGVSLSNALKATLP